MNSNETSPSEGHNLRLWICLLGGPVAWLVQLQTDYALVPWACLHSMGWLVRLVACAFLVIPAALFVWSWSYRRNPLRHNELSFGEVVVKRSQFMAILGLWLNAIFFLVIFAQALATFIIDPCGT